MADTNNSTKNRRPWLSPLNRRRVENFKANRRGYWSLWIFLILFVLSLSAEFIANDRPILVSFKGEIYTPVWKDYPEEVFLGDEAFLPLTDYRIPEIHEAIEQHGWAIWPPIRYSFSTTVLEIPEPAPSKPSWLYSKEERCQQYPLGIDDVACRTGNWNWFGTDDQARDVLARSIYGYRLSVVFGLVLTFFAAIIGVTAGAFQGYFGGWTDLLLQRVIEIWSSLPLLFLVIIIASILVPSFSVLLLVLLFFSWVGFVGVVRAEFLRARNFEYVTAARALGVRNRVIMFRHLLPNAMVATLTILPFVLTGAISTLTALDFLGFGLPPGSPSLGELLKQGQNNLQAPWLGITGFFVISIMLSLFVFIGEATRDAFDPRKTFE
ncbi:MAG: ABC transporter permease [Pseudomonadota bacterium]